MKHHSKSSQKSSDFFVFHHRLFVFFFLSIWKLLVIRPIVPSIGKHLLVLKIKCITYQYFIQVQYRKIFHLCAIDNNLSFMCSTHNPLFLTPICLSWEISTSLSYMCNMHHINVLGNTPLSYRYQQGQYFPFETLRAICLILTFLPRVIVLVCDSHIFSFPKKARHVQSFHFFNIKCLSSISTSIQIHALEKDP